MFPFYQAQVLREIQKYIDKHYRPETDEEKKARKKKPYINVFLNK